MTSAELAVIVAVHGKWRRGEPGGAGANLAGADLVDADLAHAYLAGANLVGANLAGANLAGANLVCANLVDANLVGANLAGANLVCARGLPSASPPGDPVNPPEAYVRVVNAADHRTRAERYRARHPEVPVVAGLDSKILAIVSSGEGKLEMGQWHACETTHCRAGWAITFAGDAGRALEAEHGSQRAGSMIYRASTGRVPHFFATNARAPEDIKACAAADTAPIGASE